MNYTRVAERLQSILESARIVVWEWDLATQQVRWSDNAPVTIGIRSKAMAGFSNRIHEEDRESRQQALLQALANHSDYEAEFRFLKPDGTRIWLRERGQVTLREGGTQVLVGLTSDITERKEADGQIRFQMSLLEAVEQAIFATDTAGTILYWNSFAQTLFGWAVDSVLGRHLRDVILTKNSQTEAAHILTQLLEGRGWKGEILAHHQNGRALPIHLTASPILNSLGQVVGTVGAAIDISDQKQTDALLQASETRFRDYAEIASDWLWEMDADFRFMSYIGHSDRSNELFTNFIGKTRWELAQADVASSPWREHIDQHHKQQPFRDFEFELKVQEGSKLWLSSSGRPMFARDGTFLGYRGVTRDLTERRRLEAQLQQSQKMEAVGQLTGGIAHDFNNLLMVILGNAESLAESLTDPTHRSLAQIIQEAAEKGASLTQHLLAFGRRQSLKPERVNLDQVMQRMTPLLRRTIGEHIDLVTDFSDGLQAALTDRTLLENAILNLVVNARDAMSRGGTLTLITGERSAELGEDPLPIGQPVVFITVSDTGIGMPPEVLERVFEPFFTTKDVGRGSGMGLAMVYGFAKQSGAHVSIRSKEGQGTSVTIVLPAVPSAAVEPLHPEDVPFAAAPCQESVLVVEDDLQVRQIVFGQLTSLGYAVTAVAHGPDAVAVLKADRHFDLLFTDMVLPKGMSGVELAEIATVLRPNIKVLLTSGHSQDVFERHGRPDPNMPLLRKPYTRNNLATAIRQALSGATASSAALGRILVVDDQPHNRDVVAKILTSAGHEVAVATSGAEAVQAVQAGAYDLVLMDVQMPIMDGDMATRQIRALNHPASQIPIIALSGTVLPQKIKQFKEAGMSDHVGKPFKKADLLQTVSTWLHAKRPALRSLDLVESNQPAVEDVPRSALANGQPDETALNDIRELMGREWVVSGFVRLRQQILDTFMDEDKALVDREHLGRQAHTLIAHAALLGFSDLAQRCTRLEEACGMNLDVPLRFREAKEVAEIAKLWVGVMLKDQEQD